MGERLANHWQVTSGPMLLGLGIASTQLKRRQNLSVDPFMLTSFFEKMIAPDLGQKDDSQVSKILKGVIEKYNQQLACIHWLSLLLCD
jgi:hypothetical protein